jgi:hypothetical protein
LKSPQISRCCYTFHQNNNWCIFLTQRVLTGISTINRQVPRFERPGPKVLDRNEWYKNMPWVW